MTAVMKYTVIVRHPDTDEPTALLAGKPVPGWAADLVRQDDLDGGDEAPAKGSRKSSSGKTSQNDN